MKKEKTTMVRLRFFALMIPFLIGLSVLASCEKVVDVKLRESDQIVVIEGNVSNIETTHIVRISKTVAFSNNSTDNPQSNAVVRILEENAADNPSSGFVVRPKGERTFTEISPGVYQIVNYKANPGMKYTLTVDFENEHYTASSIMPQPILIDSIGTVTESVFGDEEKTVGLVFQDPPGVKNYFRYLVTVNGVPSNLVFAFNDKFNDGKKVQRNLYHEDLELVRGDAVMVEQQCIDGAVYAYFNGILSNNSGAAAPGNPKSNFSNGALGYFSAHTIARAATSIE